MEMWPLAELVEETMVQREWEPTSIVCRAERSFTRVVSLLPSITHGRHMAIFLVYYWGAWTSEWLRTSFSSSFTYSFTQQIFIESLLCPRPCAVRSAAGEYRCGPCPLGACHGAEEKGTEPAHILTQYITTHCLGMLLAKTRCRERE